MAASSKEIVQKLSNNSQLIQIEINRNLHTGIIFHNQTYFDNALANGAEINAFAILDNGGVSKRTPLISAVSSINLYALKQLIMLGADYKVSVNGIPLFFMAVQIGCSDIVSEFLSIQDSLINTYYDMSALSQSIFSISTFPLIFGSASTWSSNTNENVDNLQTRLEDWYTTKNIDFSNTELRVQYYGDLDTIALLLGNGIDIHKPDCDGVTPLTLCTNPENHTEDFISINEETVKFISANNHVLTFQKTLKSRNHNKTLNVIVEYDFSKILKLIKAHIAAKEASPISRKSIERMVATSEEKTNEEIDRLNAWVTPMYKSHLENADINADLKANAIRAKNLAALKKDTGGRGAFYNALSHGLYNILLAFQTLESKMVKREKYAPLDKCSDILKLLSEHVPAPFGTAGALLAAITQKISDVREENKHKSITRRIELNHAPMCEDFAFEITILFKDKLTVCTKADAEKLAKEATTAALILLNDDKAFDSSKPVIEQLVAAAKKQFSAQQNSLLRSQTKKKEKCVLM